MRVVTVSDSDSYLKWAVTLMAQAPAQWDVRHVVVDNVIAPSASQVEAVSAEGPIATVSVAGVAMMLRRSRPDVIVLACTGPALEAVSEVLHAVGVLAPRTGSRPVLVSGLPGISFPANDLATHHRRHCDLFVLHSRREVRAYAEVIGRLGGPEIGLATLAFVNHSAQEAGGRDVVFAAQALVPTDPRDRLRVLRALERLPERLEPVVKVRALAGERQAHNEAHAYADLYATMPSHERAVSFRAGSMREALSTAAGFVTVSSTAAIEAIAAGVPSLVLGDFGVDAANITLVFADSGLVGDLDDLAAGRFRTPDPAWLDENYFHPEAANDWQARLAELVARRPSLGPVAFRPSGSPMVRARRLARLAPRAWRSLATTAVRRIRPGR